MLVAVKVDFADDLGSRRIEDVSSEIEEALHQQLPSVSVTPLPQSAQQSKPQGR